jgi:putative hydrolase of the HAD superfamily
MHCRALYFDAVGTLIHPEPAAAAVYAEVGRRHGSRLSGAEIRPRFAAAFRREEDVDRAAGWRTSEVRERQRWQRIVAAVLEDVRDPEACFHELYDHFARPEAWRCEPAAATVLPELRRRGLVVGLASNYDRRLRTVVAGLAPLSEIENLIISSEIGWRKPARPFFDAVCKQAGVSVREVMHIGDDFANDYAGAAAAGMQTVLVGDGGPAGTRCVAAVEELLKILD